jgi:hypothetical protein
MLQLQNVSKLSTPILRYDLEADRLTIPASRGGMLLSLMSLLQTTHGRAIGVGQCYVISTGVSLPQKLWVSFEELV